MDLREGQGMHAGATALGEILKEHEGEGMDAWRKRGTEGMIAGRMHSRSFRQI